METLLEWKERDGEWCGALKTDPATNLFIIMPEGDGYLILGAFVPDGEERKPLRVPLIRVQILAEEYLRRWVSKYAQQVLEVIQTEMPRYHTPGCYFLNVYGEECPKCLALKKTEVMSHSASSEEPALPAHLARNIDALVVDARALMEQLSGLNRMIKEGPLKPAMDRAYADCCVLVAGANSVQSTLGAMRLTQQVERVSAVHELELPLHPLNWDKKDRQQTAAATRDARMRAAGDHTFED